MESFAKDRINIALGGACQLILKCCNETVNGLYTKMNKYGMKFAPQVRRSLAWNATYVCGVFIHIAII